MSRNGEPSSEHRLIAPTPWLPQTPRADAPLRLFCFSHAGGTAAGFRPWVRRAPPELEFVPVELPGHGTRLRERPIEQMDELVSALRSALLPHMNTPFALLGVSLGATVAFELARSLRRRDNLCPVGLFALAASAPQASPEAPPLGQLADQALVQAVQSRYGGIPPEVAAERELLQLLLPTLRADLKLLESYRYSNASPLDCPIMAYYGKADRSLTAKQVSCWRQQTSGVFAATAFAGGHLFFNEDHAATFSQVQADVSRMLLSASARTNA